MFLFTVLFNKGAQNQYLNAVCKIKLLHVHCTSILNDAIMINSALCIISLYYFIKCININNKWKNIVKS